MDHGHTNVPATRGEPARCVRNGGKWFTAFVYTLAAMAVMSVIGSIGTPLVLWVCRKPLLARVERKLVGVWKSDGPTDQCTRFYFADHTYASLLFSKLPNLGSAEEAGRWKVIQCFPGNKLEHWHNGSRLDEIETLTDSELILSQPRKPREEYRKVESPFGRIPDVELASILAGEWCYDLPGASPKRVTCRLDSNGSAGWSEWGGDNGKATGNWQVQNGRLLIKAVRSDIGALPQGTEYRLQVLPLEKGRRWVTICCVDDANGRFFSLHRQ